MKKILIATDFSTAAGNATEYGVALAKSFNAKVVLFSAYQQVPIPVSEVPVVITPEEYAVHVQRQLDDVALKMSDKYQISIVTVRKPGPSTHAILDAVKEYQPDLIVTGMKKKFAAFRRILGSTVTELSRQIPVPMLVIPEEAGYTNAVNIALANEDDLGPDIDGQVLTALREIAERFHSKVFLVRVTKNRFREAYEVMNRPFRLSRILSTVDPKFECIEGNNIVQSLTQFIDAYTINMLALLPHKHSLLERWFIKSTTKSMVFESPVPLLILPEKLIKTSPPKKRKKEVQH